MSESGNDRSQDGKRGDTTRSRGGTTQVKVDATLRLDGYGLLMRAVEDGIATGVMRWARKGLTPKGLTEAHLDSLGAHLSLEIGNGIAEILAHE